MIIRDFIYNLTNTDTPLHLAGPAKSHLGGVLFLKPPPGALCPIFTFYIHGIAILGLFLEYYLLV